MGQDHEQGGYGHFQMRLTRAQLAQRERTEGRNNCVTARGLQRAWIRLLILCHELGVRNDNRRLARYKRDHAEHEFCTVTLVERARRIHLVNRLKMRL
jgi:tagatose-1,6-bisphosphate aldolase non-catalytic subunit AgaZ/GatZ